ncbi:MAG: hypothetical protein RMX68_004120 [Aulosira sp. ZfuVER01]|nr:hypothetical protein [Aulosira sp. DedVER01a]MDZ8051422.1 hypothetical protein [Aulosira sp. ZfuCHP01]
MTNDPSGDAPSPKGRRYANVANAALTPVAHGGNPQDCTGSPMTNSRENRCPYRDEKCFDNSEVNSQY